MDLIDGFEEEDVRGILSFRSRESLNKHPTHSSHLSRIGANPPSPSEGLPPVSPGLEPRSRSRQRNAAEISAGDIRASPLARIFIRQPINAPDVPEGAFALNESVEDILASVRKVENMMEGIKELPVGRLRTEMKELQVS